MPIVPTLLILWPFAMIGVTLVLIGALRRRPDHHDDVWLPPRSASLHRDAG